MQVKMICDAVIILALTVLVIFSRDHWSIILAALALIIWINLRPANSDLS